VDESFIQLHLRTTIKVALENAVLFAVEAAGGAVSIQSPAGPGFVHSRTQVGAIGQLETVARRASC